jgi:hypothetical protein
MRAAMATDYVKDPASTVQYVFNRAEWLAPGAKLTASSWEVPADLSKVADEFDDTSTKITLTGGKVNTAYAVYNTITSDDGNVQRLAFLLRVVDAALIRPTSDLENQLAALRLAISEAAINGTAEYRIAYRLKRRYTLDELLNYEKDLVARVNAERRRNGAGNTGFFKNHTVRPVEPGG